MRNRTDPRNGDPRLKTPAWKRIVAAWHRLQPTTCEAPTCLMPDTPITYGKRGPTSLDIGHVTPRALDTRRTWTIDDTRPEHSRCNQSAGTHIRTLINNAKHVHNVKTNEQAKSASKW